MTSVARKKEEYTFECGEWFSNNEEESLSVRELPAIKNGRALAEGMLILFFILFHLNSFKEGCPSTS